MKSNNRILIIYLSIVFGVWWSIALMYYLFETTFVNSFGQLNLMAPIIILSLYLPSIAGFIVAYLSGGLTAIKGMFQKLVLRKQDWKWLGFIFLFGIVFALSMHFGSILFDIKVPIITNTPFEMMIIALVNIIKEVGLLGGMFGWIGFLLPFFQTKFKSHISASLITGLVFGLWVMPAYLIPSFHTTESYPLYLAQLMIFICFQSYIFNVTKGNLLIYLFSFWLIATGSVIQLYYFNSSVQILEIIFFSISTVIIHILFKYCNVKLDIQKFPDYLFYSKDRAKEVMI